MKHNLLKSVILSVILVMGVSNAWAAGDRIYLKPNSNWTQENPRFAAYFFKDNNGGETWVSMFKEGDIYVCEIPSGYPNVIFCRMNGANSDNKWDNKWNQSSDLKATNNEGKLYTVENGTWDKGNGSWSDIQWNIQGSFVGGFETKYPLNCDIELEAGSEYAFKVTNNHNAWYGNDGKMTRQYHEGWIMANSVQSNCTITTDIAGTYKFSYNKKTNALTVTYPEDCYLSGEFNNWAENATSSLKSGSVTLNLAANKTYKFKIHNFGATSESWHGNTGTMKRNNCTEWKMDADADCYITTDFAGNYIFRYDRSTQKLSVEYPAVYTVTYGVGTNKGTDEVTTDPPISSGSLVLASTSITFSKGETKAGYQWKNWNTNANGTDKNLGTNATYTSSNRNANTTVYACYDLITYNITYNLDGGTGATNTTYNVESAAITLPTAPTKTGYTFAGWYDNANLTGNKVTQIAKGSTGDKTFYAKWTANTYQVQFNGNGNTSGSMNRQSFTYDAAEKALTTNGFQKIGYTFTEWNTAADGSGTSYKDKQSVKNLTTENNATITLYAQWTALPPQTVYLRPVDFWPSDYARFAVYYWEGEANGWAEMNTVGCEKDYYYANIPGGYTHFKYVRLNPAGKGDADKNDGLHFDHSWNQTGDLVVQPDKMYTTPRMYFKPNDAWKSDGARFAAYFFKKEGETTHEYWMSMIQSGNVYWCDIPTNHAYDQVIFCRMNPAVSDNNFNDGVRWDQTNDLSLLHEHIQGNNYYVVTKANKDLMTGDIGEWSTYWETPSPTYDVILDPFQYGQYGVNINGKTYYSKPSEQVVIENVALGTQVTVIDAVANTTQYGPKLNPTSGEPWYHCSVVVTPNSSATVKHSVDKVNGVPQHTVCGYTTFTPYMVTTASHRVYLHIPTSLTGSWNASGANNYVWATEYLSNKIQGRPGTLVTMTKDTYLSDKGDGEYWYADIPAGYNKFYFERKDTDDGDRIRGTEWFIYGIPLNNINCYTLTGNTGNDYTGIWEVTPTSVGDYRLLYVEQEVRKSNLSGNEWKTVVANTYNHPSDVVKPYTVGDTHTNIVSLHVYKDKQIDGKTCNPEVILQMCTEATYNNGNGKWTYTWRDIEAHMVNGPLEAEPGMAMLPGRKKASSDSDVDDFVYDDGIEIIKNDKKVGRVWNFTIQQFKSPTTKKDTATLLLDKEHLKPYEGNYYIRTNNADGGWSNYTIPANHMNHSHYAEANSGYSHYFCKWIDIDPNNTIGTHKNVKFIVANDYGVAISKELAQDDFTDADGNLSLNTNVRWSWNQYTNEAKRAYIQGSSVNGFLTASVKRDETTSHGFRDNGNWIYESNLTAIVGDQLTDIIAPYQGHNQELLEERYQQDGGLVMLTGDENNTNVYDVRVMFDFKINKTTVFLVPNEHEASTAIDVLIERVNHEQATQVKTKAAVTAADQEKGVTVHAAMTFTKANVANLNNNKSQRLFYWVSFPFDVRISEVFGFGEYGVHWIMQYYDGEERAQKGCWADSPTYWRYVTDTANLDNSTTLNSGILKANQGYVLALATNIANMGVFTYTDQVSLYFPSYNPIKNINDQVIKTAVTLPEYKCTINRPTPDGDRRFKDSNWHLIGIPSYADKTRQLTQEGVLYYYVREYDTDDYAVTKYKNSAVDVTFQSMHSYFVQFAGTINWAEESWTLNAPEQMAAKRNANYKSNEHTLRVELQQSNEKADQTYITLQEEATPAFDMNKDLTKVINSGANIYSLITTEETPIEVAGNVLPVGESIIPLGVKTSKAGEYTFAMPDGTDGIIVELIDYETNTRTNMTLDEYTVNLGKGTFETRFALHVKPDKTVTSVEDINTNSDGVRKFIIDGVLYMQKDGMLYDAQGKLVR